jgi:hypothetical protein
MRSWRGASIVLLVMLAGAPPAHAKLPGLYAGEYPAKFSVRPHVVGGWTNDGSGFVGGPGANPPRSFGRVKWTRWGSKSARGRAVVWTTSDRMTWGASRTTTVVASRPRKGRFTRLSFSFDAGDGFRRHSYRFRALNPAWLPR